MLYKAKQQPVQGVQWDGAKFSETPDWLPPRVSLCTFATTDKTVISSRPPYAWLGNGSSSSRINPGDEVVLDHGRIQVISGHLFSGLFEPDTQSNTAHFTQSSL